MLPKEAIANVEQIRGLVHEGNVLRAALTEIKEYAESQMGEWSSVQPPYLPAEMEVLYDIIEMCESAANNACSGQERAEATPEPLPSN